MHIFMSIIFFDMEECITKDDLRQFGLVLINEVKEILNAGEKKNEAAHQPEWLKGRAVRKLLDISSGTLQNLRISGKIRYRKVLGSYYYNRSDLMKLFLES